MSFKISHSQLNKFKASPFQWYAHYMLRLRQSQAGSALFFGTAFGDAANAMVKNKFQDENIDWKELFLYKWKKSEFNGKKIDLSKSDVVKYSKSDTAEAHWLLDNEEDQKLLKKHKLGWVSLRRKGLLMLDAYEKQVLPHIADLYSTQQYIKIPNSQGDYIMGYLDLFAEWKWNEKAENASEFEHLKKFDGKKVIFDDKTTSVVYGPGSVEKSTQLATYAEAPNIPAHDFEGYIAVHKKFRKTKKPMVRVEIIIDKVAPEVVESTFEGYESLIRTIKTGNFNCTGNCKKEFWGCPYAKYCESGGTDLEGLVFVKKGSK